MGSMAEWRGQGKDMPVDTLENRTVEITQSAQQKTD